MTIPKALAGLPVARKAAEFDWAEKSILTLAQVSTGKTMILPALEALSGNRTGPVLLRQPTRVTCEAVYRGLQRFWEDEGLRVGIRTATKEEGLSGADIIVHSDGSLRPLVRREKPASLHSDEIHWLSTLHEIELAYAKHERIPIRAHSATVDPASLISYLDDPAVHRIEGRTHPITRDTIVAHHDTLSRSDPSELDYHVDDWVYGLVADGDSGLCFLPTKDMCERQVGRVGIEARYLHGQVDPIDVMDWAASRDGPWAVFSTTAAATGVTLDIGRTLIADEEITSVQREGIETVQSRPVTDNMLIQMAGRTGRIRPGFATLLTPEGTRPMPTSRDRSIWLSPIDRQPVKPRPIEAPCASATPYDVVLHSLGMGIEDPRDLDILSDIDPNEMRLAVQWANSARLTKPGGLSAMGQQVANFPLGAQYAHLVLTAPSPEAQNALFAAFCYGLSGTWGLVNSKPDRCPPTRDVWPSECLVRDSVPLSLAKTLAVYPQCGDDWLRRTNLKPAPLRAALRDYNRRPPAPGTPLHTIDFDRIAPEVYAHLSRSPVFRVVPVRGDKAARRNPFSPCDAVFSRAFNWGNTWDLRNAACIVRQRAKKNGRGSIFPLEMLHLEAHA